MTGVRSPDTPHPDTIPPACLWTLSSFAAWLDHQPCKEDLWPWSTQNDICWGLGNHGESDKFRAKSLVVVGGKITRKYLQLSTNVSREMHQVQDIWPPKWDLRVRDELATVSCPRTHESPSSGATSVYLQLETCVISSNVAESTCPNLSYCSVSGIILYTLYWCMGRLQQADHQGICLIYNPHCSSSVYPN